CSLLLLIIVVPGFIVQGGDPTGTGSGGDSIYGAPFKDEFHSRLRFNRRGLVAMANAGPHDNGSQFFFTLGRADELNNKHTIFGKVTGDTIYNMLRLAEVEVDKEERPLSPHKIRSSEVLFNPFDDIVPRPNRKLKKDKPEEEDKKPKVKGTKEHSSVNDAEVNSMKGKSKSSHDLLKDDPHLSSVPAVKRLIQVFHIPEQIYFQDVRPDTVILILCLSLFKKVRNALLDWTKCSSNPLSLLLSTSNFISHFIVLSFWFFCSSLLCSCQSVLHNLLACFVTEIDEQLKTQHAIVEIH
uniref:Peptidyl-prolyl cis-trans isomerase n=1 Tax=Pavo cristatus TaxID=9049 RepID=A0A8C9F6G7_PAVCR